MGVPQVFVNIWMHPGFDTALGQGHAGLQIETANGQEEYITWLMDKYNHVKACPRVRSGGIPYTFFDDQERLFHEHRGGPTYRIDVPVLTVDTTKQGMAHGVDIDRMLK